MKFLPFALLALAMTLSARTSADVTIGPFAPSPAVAIYLVADGKPLTAHVTVRQGPRADGDRVMVRAFDQDENLAVWKYLEPGHKAALGTRGDGERDIPTPDFKPAGQSAVWYETDLDLAKAGIYQIRVTSGTGNALVSVTTSRDTGYGVSFQNGNYAPWPGQPSKLYAYIPPHAEELNVSGGPVSVSTDTGEQAFSLDGSAAAKPGKAAVTKTDAVWTFDFPKPNQWQMRAWGFPVILCPTADAALAIHASVDLLPDGTAVTWKFQRKIAEMLPKLLVPENVGTADQLIVPLSTRKAEWLKNPLRNVELLSPYCAYSAVQEALRNQNVDPASHWGGAMGSAAGGKLGGWKVLESLPAPQNRWDRLKTIDGLAGGASPRSLDAEGLAVAATVNAPFNPYYGNKKLLYRAAASALRDLMTLGEDEVWRGEYSDNDPYPGNMAFSLGQKTAPTYALAAPLMPPDIRALWTEGMRHLIDRSYSDGLVSARNQSSHFLVIYEQFAQGSGDPLYERLAKAYAGRFIDGITNAGYAVESQGPDGTYNGMSHWHMALYYRMSGDKEMAAAIRKSYRFFNATVAPEPDGTMVGASNFGHRTAGGFDHEQWGGARGIANDLPEVALWSPPMTPEQKAKREADAVKTITGALAQPPAPEGPSIATPHYEYFDTPADRSGVFPANEKASFLRDIGGELVSVKRPAYYAAVFVGHPAPHPLYIAHKDDFRQPLPNDAENTGALAAYRKVTPFLGGGLSLFQTPQYGNAVLAANWSPLVHHGLVAVRPDGARYWEDYFASKYAVDQAAGTLTITGQVEGEPLRYERRYTFGDDALAVRLTITADKDVTLSRLFENIPVAEGAIKARGVKIMLGGATGDAGSSDNVTVRDNTGVGVDVRFDGAQALRVQTNGLRIDAEQIGRVEVELPASLKAGQSVELSYRLVPTK